MLSVMAIFAVSSAATQAAVATPRANPGAATSTAAASATNVDQAMVARSPEPYPTSWPPGIEIGAIGPNDGMYRGYKWPKTFSNAEWVYRPPKAERGLEEMSTLVWEGGEMEAHDQRQEEQLDADEPELEGQA